MSIFVDFLVPFGRFLSFLSFLEGLGGLEWSKMVRGTRTIHFPVPIPHIDHSRAISIRFWVSKYRNDLGHGVVLVSTEVTPLYLPLSHTWKSTIKAISFSIVMNVLHFHHTPYL